MKTIGFSEISTYLTCREKYRRDYALKVPEKPQPRLAFGTVVHAGLEAALRASIVNSNAEEALSDGCYKAIDRIEKSFVGMQTHLIEEITERIANAPAVAIRALKWLNLDRWETLKVDGEPIIESQILTPVMPGVQFRATMDWVARDRNDGTCWQFEFKTRKTLTPVVLGEISLQQACYQHVLAQKGLRIEGAMEFAIRADLPKEPKMNKDGKSMSRAVCATDWPTYKAALIRNGLDPIDYTAMQIDLEAKEWFRLVPQYRTLDECSRTWQSVVVPVVREITETPLNPIPILARHVCQSCAHLEPCLENVRGRPSSFEMELLEEESVD